MSGFPCCNSFSQLMTRWRTCNPPDVADRLRLRLKKDSDVPERNAQLFKLRQNHFLSNFSHYSFEFESDA